MDKNVLDMKTYASNTDEAYLINYMLSGKEDAIHILNSSYLFKLISEMKKENDINIITVLKFEALIILKEVYLALCLFKNNEVVQMFKQLGFVDDELVWLFEYSIIHKIFYNLDNNDAVESVNKEMILSILLFYNTTNIWKCLIKKLRIKDRKHNIAITEKRLQSVITNFKQKTEYRKSQGKELEKDEFDIEWQKLEIEEPIHKAMGMSKEKYYSNLISKSDHLLIPIFTKYIKFKKNDSNGKVISVNRQYQIAYPLLQYLMPDKSNWYSDEKSYLESGDTSGYSFDMLMAKRMERFIKKDKRKPKKI
jgi:hypothetical protein